jgi:hypothetical protein
VRQGGSGAGHSHKHSGAHKAKHTPHKAHKKHAPGHHPKPVQGPKPILVTVVSNRRNPPKPRGWSPGSDVACCSAEALGTLLALSGRPWSYEDTLSLYWSTASHPDAGASILATLEAARGLLGDGRPPEAVSAVPVSTVHAFPPGRALPLILGVALPEPHAVAVGPDGTWWSWGEPFDPDDWPDLVVEEAWAVSL